MKTIFRLGLGLGLAGGLAASALAHAKLVSADPGQGAVAAAGLTRLHIGFSERLAAKLSGASITDAAGKAAPTDPATLDPADAKAMVVQTKAPLKAGVYKVAWRAVASDDGHKTMGSYSFTLK